MRRSRVRFSLWAPRRASSERVERRGRPETLAASNPYPTRWIGWWTKRSGCAWSCARAGPRGVGTRRLPASRPAHRPQTPAQPDRPRGRREADRALAKLIGDVYDGRIATGAPAATVDELLERWLDLAGDDLSPSTL